MTDIYINGMGCVSPQLTAGSIALPAEMRVYHDNRIICVEPDYSALFDAGTARRMSRVAKFATSAAVMAMREAGLKKPDAIITGTGFGLLENSGKFLKSVIEQDEAAVSPTSFIQSTHNTIGGNIALMTGGHGHNNTFSQKGTSFEAALMDTMMLMQRGNQNILVGAFDELTDYSSTIMERLGFLRQKPCDNSEMYQPYQNGVIAGEGAAFFVLSNNKSDLSYGKLVDADIFCRTPNKEAVEKGISSFLEENGIALNEIDIVISGLNGNHGQDILLREINDHIFGKQTILGYKHLCGEYMTSTAFALYLSSHLLKSGVIPKCLILKDSDKKPMNILIHNTYQGDHTLILVSSC